MIVNPFSYLIEKLKGKVDKSGDTMQYLSIDRPSATTSATTSYAMLGNNVAEGNIGNSYGLIYLYGKGTRYTQIDAPDSTANRTIHLPNASGTVALTSDLQPKMLPAVLATTAVGGKYYAVLGHFQSAPTISKVNVLGVGDAPLSDFSLASIDANNNYAIYTTSSSYVGKAISVYF